MANGLNNGDQVAVEETPMKCYMNIDERWGDYVPVTESDYYAQAEHYGAHIVVTEWDGGLYINGDQVAVAVKV